MSIHFVSTSVLTSEDGLEFTDEVKLESAEALRVRQEGKWRSECTWIINMHIYMISDYGFCDT